MPDLRIVSRLTLCFAAAAMLLVAAVPQVAVGDEASNTVDKLWFKDGRVIEGQILEETEDQITMMVSVGSIRQKFTFDRGTIQVIEYDQPVEGVEEDDNKATPGVDADSVGICVVPLQGDFGFHVSKTPLRESLEAAERTDAKYVVLKLNCQKGSVWSLEDMFQVVDSFQQRWSGDDDPNLIIWVQYAVEGAGLMPFTDRDVYFTRDGWMGGVTSFDDNIRGHSADEMVKDKWVSATMGHIEGVAIDEGYDVRLVRAMVIEKNELSVDFVGGQPVYHDDLSGQLILTDSGEGDFADEETSEGKPTLIKNRNDVLNIDAEMAYRLRISQGMADTVDELADHLRLRKWHLVEGKPQRQIDRWTEGLDRDLPRIRELLQSIPGRVGRYQGEYRERVRARGAVIKDLNELERLIKRYAEVLDPNQNYLMQIELWRFEVKQDAKEDRESQRP